MQDKKSPIKVKETLPKGEAHKLYIKALNYINGGDGFSKDPIEAARLLHLAAEHGDKDAQYYLGNCYKEGSGVEKHQRTAAQFYRLAADQGHAGAQCNLGLCYETELGVAKDEREAAKWYRLAADQGHANAQYRLGLCYERSVGVLKNEKEAVRLYRLAADQGHANAQYRLGLCYERSVGVPKDEKEAAQLYRLAAVQNRPSAQSKLEFDFASVSYVERELFIVKRDHSGEDLPKAIYLLLYSDNKVTREKFTQHLIELMQFYGRYKDSASLSPDIMKILNTILQNEKLYSLNIKLAAVILNYPNLYMGFKDKQILSLAKNCRFEDTDGANVIINALKTGKMDITHWWKIFDSLKKNKTVQKDILDHFSRCNNDPGKKAFIKALHKHHPEDGFIFGNSTSALMLICRKNPLFIAAVQRAAKDLEREGERLLSKTEEHELTALQSNALSSAERKARPNSTTTELGWIDIHAFVQKVCGYNQALFLSNKKYSGEIQDGKQENRYDHLNPQKKALLLCMDEHLKGGADYLNPNKQVSEEDAAALFLTLLNDSRYSKKLMRHSFTYGSFQEYIKNYPRLKLVGKSVTDIMNNIKKLTLSEESTGTIGQKILAAYKKYEDSPLTISEVGTELQRVTLGSSSTSSILLSITSGSSSSSPSNSSSNDGSNGISVSKLEYDGTKSLGLTEPSVVSASSSASSTLSSMSSDNNDSSSSISSASISSKDLTDQRKKSLPEPIIFWPNNEGIRTQDTIPPSREMELTSLNKGKEQDPSTIENTGPG